MKIITDFQIHSRFARATSKDITLDNLEKWARIKGLNLLGTGDFQHPKWFLEINEKLDEDEKGILWSKNKFPFFWQTEISLMYTQNGRGRRVHHLILAPNKDVARQIIEALGKKGRLDYDGRPIFGFSSIELVEMMVSISKDIEIIPAHVWTPYFGLFGSITGFDSVEECFKEKSKYIHALETGMSSSPAMNWTISDLDKYTLVSNSDAHCVHPDTLITLEDGYILPISEIGNDLIVAHANLKYLSYTNGVKTQYSKILSSNTLKEIKYAGGEIKTSPQHRFYVLKEHHLIEKYASEIKKGDMLLRLAKIGHNDKGAIKLKSPDINFYYSSTNKGIKFIKQRRIDSGFTQKQLANLIGIYKDHYWKIEKGLIKINSKILNKIANILNFSYNDFIKNNTLYIYPNVKFPKTSSTKLLELLGYFMGGGCSVVINRGRCLMLTDKNKKLLYYYQCIVKELFFCDCRLFKYSYQNSYGLIIPAPVAHFFILNFPEALLKSNKRRIPRTIYTTKLEEISGFLRGFFDAESAVGHHGIDVCSANILLLYQVDMLLKKFDICSSIYLNKFEKNKKKFRHRIVLYGENLNIYKNKINFNHEIKKNKLIKYVNKINIFRKSKIKRYGDFAISEVKSVRDIGSDTIYLYDLSVPGYKNYIANQLIVHNSYWPWRLGRESNIFDIDLSYNTLINAIRTKKGFIETIEVDPNYGKYHFDGHRNCNFSCSPEESNKLNNICPICKKPLTIGVLNRVNQLADRNHGFVPKDAIPFKTLIPLSELIAAVYKVNQVYSKKVWDVYNKLINAFVNEFKVLLDINLDALKKIVDEKLANYIILNREGKLMINPGYDGVYGKIIIGQNQKTNVSSQSSLSDFS